MVYKKFIRKNGKVYGPYNYHSKRIDGKVVSEYHGKKNKIGLNFSFYTVLFLLFLFVIFFVANKTNLTGNAIVSLNSYYSEDNSLDGTFSLSLKEGELIPASTHLLIEDSTGKQYDFLLSDILDENKIEGNYFIEGKSLSGQGEGYGVLGDKIFYPSLSFELEFLDLKQQDKPVSETKEDSKKEVIEENKDNSNQEQDSQENSNEDQAEEVAEKTTEEASEETVQEDKQDEIVEEQQTSDIEKEEVKEDNSESEKTESIDSSESESSESAPITGEAISSGGESKFFNFIKSLSSSITGMVTNEKDNSLVFGKISNGETFSQNVPSNKEVRLKKGSIKDVSGNTLPDEVLSLEKEGSKVMVYSSYYEFQEGFGEEFLGEGIAKEIKINLSQLDLDLEQGEVIVKAIYSDSELVSLKTNLTIGENIVESPEEIVKTNVSRIILSETIDEREREILSDYFYNQSVRTIKAEIIGERLNLKHEIGDYWVRYSYDYNSLEPNEEISILVEKDLVRWLNDLAENLPVSEKTLNLEKEENGFLVNRSILDLGKEEIINPEQQPVSETKEDSKKEVIEENKDNSNQEQDSQENSNEDQAEEVAEKTTEEASEETVQEDTQDEIVEEQQTSDIEKEQVKEEVKEDNSESEKTESSDSSESESSESAPITGEAISSGGESKFFNFIRNVYERFFQK